MAVTGLFGTFLFLIMILADWMQFGRLSASASRYGCRIARQEDRFAGLALRHASAVFDANGWLHLPHGIARLLREKRCVVLKPSYHKFAQFRSAWPMKGTLELFEEETSARVVYTKRMPWSSVLITGFWFLVVGFGSLWFLGSYLWMGGAATLGSVLLGLGMMGMGLLVLAFGTITFVFAYRLEDQRLGVVYQELRSALASADTATDPPALPT